MKSVWMTEISTVKPEEFEKINDNQWKQHVNIHKKTDETTGEEVYESNVRILDSRSYEALVNTVYTPAQEQLKGLMGASDDNQSAIMEALAEIYEIVLGGAKND